MNPINLRLLRKFIPPCFGKHTKTGKESKTKDINNNICESGGVLVAEVLCFERLVFLVFYL